MEIDADGFLVNPAGLRVQGYSADAEGNIMPSLDDIDIGNKSSSPSATEDITFNLNLSADEPVGPGFDVLDPAFTSQFSTSVTVYDSLGKAHQADVYFEKSAANEWTYHVTVDDGELQGGTGGSLSEIATGTLTFNSDGQLDSHVQVGGTVNFADAETQSFLFDFGASISTGGDGQATTQHSGQSAVELVDQDGFGSGRLQFLVFEDDGTVVGTFTNGRVLPVGQIATALFLSPGNLSGVGDNLFRASTDSGSPAIGAPASGGRGQVFSGALEQSNVDLTREFTEMIVTQRAFQASSRTISTSDEMLAEIVNLKR
jgi:flagellar hook protein FlgE